MLDETSEVLYPSFGYMSGLFVDIYRQMDLVIGMRGHANIIPFGQNTPCIGIGEHNKVLWFLEEVDLMDAYVPLNFDMQTNKNELSKTIDRIITNLGTYKSNMATKKNKLTSVKDSFVDRIVGVL